MSILVSRTHFTDFEALQDVIQDNRSDVMQLGTGPMEGSVTHLTFDPNFSISTGDFSHSMIASGVMSHSRWALGMLTKSDGLAMGHRSEFGPGELAVAAPGEDRIIKFQNGSEYIAALIDPVELETFLRNRPGAYESLAANHRLSILHASSDEAKNNIRMIKPLIDWLSNANVATPDDAAAFYKLNVMDALTSSVRAASRRKATPHHRFAHGRLFREIDHYIRLAGHRPIHTIELCQTFNVQPRTLQRVFEDIVGISPIAYLRRRRLNDVHTALRNGDSTTTVKTIARNHGFLHLSRFAAEYQNQFGELPSQTLGRALQIGMNLMLLFLLTGCRAL